VGTSYQFNSNGPPWAFDAQNVPAETATTGVAGKRADAITQPAKTVMFTEAALLIPELWHRGKVNVVAGDGHVAMADLETLQNTDEYRWGL
jgi:prepilin-type processing-associated H-X9-DG protein